MIAGILLSTVLISCSENRPGETSQVQAKTGFKEIPGWIGTFQDTLPCADCPGQLTWLEISPDGYYRRISTRIGEADVFAHTRSTKARWKFDPVNEVISLDSATEQDWLGLLPFGDSLLLACDRKGVPLEGGRWKLRRRSGGDGLPGKS